MGRGLIILLVASLGLNIFAVGHFSGRMLAGGPPPFAHKEPRLPRMAGGDPYHVMHHTEQLSPELREQFGSEFRSQLPSLREEHTKMRALHRELYSLMSAETWDGYAINAKMDEILAVRQNQRQAFTGAFLSAFEGLPAEERKRLIETANKERSHRRHKRKKYRKKHGTDDDR